MMDFYSRVVGMDTQNRTFQYIVSLRGMNSEVRLQRVYDEDEVEVIGRLALEMDESGFDRLLKNRERNPFELRTGRGGMEVEICDPDGNRVYVTQDQPAVSAA